MGHYEDVAGSTPSSVLTKILWIHFGVLLPTPAQLKPSYLPVPPLTRLLKPRCGGSVPCSPPKKPCNANPGAPGAFLGALAWLWMGSLGLTTTLPHICLGSGGCGAPLRWGGSLWANPIHPSAEHQSSPGVLRMRAPRGPWMRAPKGPKNARTHGAEGCRRGVREPGLEFRTGGLPERCLALDLGGAVREGGSGAIPRVGARPGHGALAAPEPPDGCKHPKGGIAPGAGGAPCAPQAAFCSPANAPDKTSDEASPGASSGARLAAPTSLCEALGRLWPPLPAFIFQQQPPKQLGKPAGWGEEESQSSLVDLWGAGGSGWGAPLAPRPHSSPGCPPARIRARGAEHFGGLAGRARGAWKGDEPG